MNPTRAAFVILAMLGPLVTHAQDYPFASEDRPTPAALMQRATDARGGVLLLLKGGVEMRAAAVSQNGAARLLYLADREDRHILRRARYAKGYWTADASPVMIGKWTVGVDYINEYTPGGWKVSSTLGSDGHVAWVKAPNLNRRLAPPYRDLKFSEPASADHVMARVLAPWMPVDLLKWYERAETRSAVEFAGEACWRVRLDAKDGRRDMVYLSKSTGHVRGFEVDVKPDDSNGGRWTLSGYRPIGGVRVPTRIHNVADYRVTHFEWKVPDIRAFTAPHRPHENIGDSRLTLLDGGVANLRTHRGKRLVLLQFCGSERISKRAVAQLQPVAAEFRDRVATYAVHIQGDENAVRTLTRETPDVTPALDFGGRLFKVTGLRGYPAVVLLGLDGTVKKTLLNGPADAIGRAIREVLKE